MSVLDDFYPGSRVRRQQAPAPAPAVDDDVLGEPRFYLVLQGIRTGFYTVGQVAAAIGRRPGTLRSWETEGILPESGYRKPAKDARGRYRLYSREQAEGIVRVARQTGIIDPGARLPLYDFTDKVWALFRELRGDKNG